MNNRRISVLHLIDSGWPSGINTFVLELLNSINHSRFKVGVCSFSDEGPLLQEMRNLGTDVHVSRTLWNFFRRIRTGRYQILHANHGGRACRYIASAAGCRIVAHAHGLPEAGIDPDRKGNQAMRRGFEAAFGACADAIVSCSHSVSESLSQADPAFESRLSTIYNGTDLNRQRLVSPEEKRTRKLNAGLPIDGVVVGYAGRLVTLKGIDCLLAAAGSLIGHHPNLHFLIMGEGPLRAELQRQAISFGDRIRFLGWRNSSDWFPVFDILALPSASEGMPYAVLEAMGWGIPVVASDVGGLPEAVVNGQTGILVTPRSAQNLEVALDVLIRSPGMRHRMGIAARARAELIFDSRAMARNLEELYAKLAPQRTRAVKACSQAMHEQSDRS